MPTQGTHGGQGGVPQGMKPLPSMGSPGAPLMGDDAHHELDDDPELAHIGDFAPPPIDVAPPAAEHAGYEPPRFKQGVSAIQHVPPLGPLADRFHGHEHAAAPAAAAPSAAPPAPAGLPPGVDPVSGKRVVAFRQSLGEGGHMARWKRRPNVTGTGAIHVKSFHCKLTGDSLEFLDNQINEWLDANPEYEVKMVTTSVGEWTGKTKEPCLVVNVWV